jgi:hypothetical protein
MGPAWQRSSGLCPEKRWGEGGASGSRTHWVSTVRRRERGRSWASQSPEGEGHRVGEVTGGEGAKRAEPTKGEVFLFSFFPFCKIF